MTDEHVIERRADGSIKDRYTLGKNRLVHLGSDLGYNETTDIRCSCGEKFDNLDQAKDHLISVDDPQNGLTLNTGTDQ